MQVSKMWLWLETLVRSSRDMLGRGSEREPKVLYGVNYYVAQGECTQRKDMRMKGDKTI